MEDYSQYLLDILLQVGFLERRPDGMENECRITGDGIAAFNALSWFAPCQCGDKNCQDDDPRYNKV